MELGQPVYPRQNIVGILKENRLSRSNCCLPLQCVYTHLLDYYFCNQPELTMSEEASGKELLPQIHSSLSAVDVLLNLPPVNELLGVDHTLHIAHCTQTHSYFLLSVHTRVGKLEQQLRHNAHMYVIPKV